MAAQEKLDPWSHRDESPAGKSLRQDRGKGETQGQQKPGSRLKESILQVTKLEFELAGSYFKVPGCVLQWKVPGQETGQL